MASQPGKTDSERPEVVSADDRQIVAEMASVQREKIELAGRFLEVSQQENQRHYEFLSKQLEVQDGQNKRTYRLGQFILGGFGVVLFLLVYMVFYGSEDQSVKAMKILSEGAKALGGAGVIFLVYGGLKRLLNR